MQRTEYARTLENERDMLIDERDALRAENARLREIVEQWEVWRDLGDAAAEQPYAEDVRAALAQRTE